MGAFRCVRALAAPATRPTTLFKASASRWSTSQQTRSLTLLTPRRPLLPGTSSPMPSFQLPGSGATLPATTTSSESVLDLAGKISQHPALGSMQIRAGPRDTYNPSHLVRKRRHGFLARLKTKKGRKLLMRRIKKGRWNMSH